jgi:3-deoxy-D-manno-octulosonate 8-phosphate phosphatase KdsC-like HAD superfamily phosphatase
MQVITCISQREAATAIMSNVKSQTVRKRVRTVRMIYVQQGKKNPGRCYNTAGA